MITHDEYERRVDACLDARRDPLDDADVVAFLEAHPDALDVFAMRREALRTLRAIDAPHDDAAPRATPAARRPWLLVGAGAAAAALIWLAASSRGPQQSVTVAPHADAPRILAARLEELRSPLRTAGTYTIRHAFVQSSTLTLETYEQRSEPR